MINKKGISAWIWILVIIILIVAVVYFLLTGGSDGGSSNFLGSSIPTPPSLPE